MKFPQYISTNERTVSVVGMLCKDETEEAVNAKYQHGKGYIDEDEQIWIFSNEKPKNKNEYPYFWFEDGEKKFSDPPEIIKKAYCVSNMVDMNLVNIIEKTEPGEQLFNEKEITDMNAAAAVYVPIINESDDFLKKIVKTTIIQKGVDLNKLKSKTDEKYILPNMKAALQNKTKMSVVYFCCWMNLLGCDFDITIQDNGEDERDPLKTPISYSSYTNKITKDCNGEIVDITPHSDADTEENENEQTF